MVVQQVIVCFVREVRQGWSGGALLSVHTSSTSIGRFNGEGGHILKGIPYYSRLHLMDEFCYIPVVRGSRICLFAC